MKIVKKIFLVFFKLYYIFQTFLVLQNGRYSIFKYFCNPVYVHTYEQQISFFYHMPCYITLFISLLHCFHPETSFVLDL